MNTASVVILTLAYRQQEDRLHPCLYRDSPMALRTWRIFASTALNGTRAQDAIMRQSALIGDVLVPWIV